MAIGTTAALIGASVAGSAIQAGSARSAANAQRDAAQNQVQLQERVYNDIRDLMAPYRDSGGNALNALNFELGLGARPTIGGTAPEITEITDTPVAASGPRIMGNRDDRENARLSGAYNPAQPQPTTRFAVGGQMFDTRDAAQAYADANRTGGTEYQGFQKTPGYDFQLSEGINAIDRSAASSGGLFSGATLKAAQTYGQGLANQGYDTYLNRLTGLASSGQNAAASQGAAAQNYAAGAGQAYANMGNASAAGAIGTGNAINSGIGNAIGVWQYQNALSPAMNPAAGGLTSSIRPRPNPLYG